MMEMELKLMVPPAQRSAVLDALDLTHTASIQLRAHYFDTPGGDLAAQGVSVRLRREGKVWVQTVKASGDSQVRRFEDNASVKVKGRAYTGARRPELDLSLHGGAHAIHAVAKALKSFKSSKAEGVLSESYATDVARRARLMSWPGETIEIAFDEGVVKAGVRQLPLCEVELELKAGTAATQLFSLARTLVADHQLCLSTLAKSSRGAALARPGEAPPVQRAGPMRWNPDADGDRQLRAMVGHCLDQMLPNASHVAAGSTDADQIHQLRVGIRRLRTVLREVGELSASVDPAWEAPLSSAFSDLGAYRDHEAVQEAVGARLAKAGAPTAQAFSAESSPPPSPEATVRDPGFQRVLIDLLEFSLGEAATAEAIGSKATRRLFKKRLQKLHTRVVADGKRFTELPAEQQHQIRKRLKRLRYLSEFAEPTFGRRSVERYLRHLRPAQDALGEHNDDAVALEGFQQRAATDGPAWFAVGWLTARQEQTAKQCRKALRRIGEVEPFWG